MTAPARAGPAPPTRSPRRHGAVRDGLQRRAVTLVAAVALVVLAALNHCC